MPVRPSLVLTLALVLPAAAAQAADIAYVDMQRVLEESALGKKVQDELRKDFEPKAQALGKEEQEIRRLQETLARDAALMSKDQVAKKEAEIKKRIESYQKEAGAVQQTLMKVQQEKGPQVIGPARKAVDAIAKKRKLSMVVERGTSGIVYMEEALDITPEVIKQMDAGAK
jgi:outer membrane protein